MAYADATHTTRNLGTAAAVTLIEAGLAFAVVTGLMMSVERNPPRPPLTTFDVPPPTIEPPAQPPETRSPLDPAPRLRHPLDQAPVDLGPGTATAFPSDGESAGGSGIGEVSFPTPIPSPSPSFAPAQPRPRGKPGLWVTPDDYPASAIRAENKGITRFRLAVDATGKVTGCAVTASSGWPLLDETACARLVRRARFEPATDSTGARAAGHYNGAVNWRLPAD